MKHLSVESHPTLVGQPNSIGWGLLSQLSSAICRAAAKLTSPSDDLINTWGILPCQQKILAASQFSPAGSDGDFVLVIVRASDGVEMMEDEDRES